MDLCEEVSVQKVSDICFQCSFSFLYVSIFPAAIACVSVF